MVAVTYDHRITGRLAEYLGILSGKGGQFPDRTVFFKNYLPIVISIYFQWVAFPDAHRPTNFLRDNYAPKIIDPSHNSCGFHFLLPPKACLGFLEQSEYSFVQTNPDRYQIKRLG